ncbi:MAG: leucine-rich repeat protein [Oscillospiraceae bacterium]|nr:leucine-rich repeat protein [Oscillospiraceae bacterium]
MLGKVLVDCVYAEGDIVIPEGTVSICNSAFEYPYRDDGYNTDGITGITLPESLVRIEDYALSDLKNVKEITVPASVTYIGPVPCRAVPISKH